MRNNPGVTTVNINRVAFKFHYMWLSVRKRCEERTVHSLIWKRNLMFLGLEVKIFKLLSQIIHEMSLLIWILLQFAKLKHEQERDSVCITAPALIQILTQTEIDIYASKLKTLQCGWKHAWIYCSQIYLLWRNMFL